MLLDIDLPDLETILVLIIHSNNRILCKSAP